MSRQTGVSISANDTDAASGKRIAVVLRDVSLSDAMNSLWSLLSHKQAFWHWNRAGKPGAFTYRLTCSNDARQYGPRTRQAIQTSFEEEADTLIRGFDMTAEERNALAKTNPRAASYLAEERTRNGLRFFASLPSETKQRVLRGEQVLHFSVQELSPIGKDFANATWRDEGLGANHSVATQLTIKTEVSTGDVSPWLCIAVGDAEGTTGTGYVGGVPFEAEWQERLAVDWQLPDDKESDVREGKALQKPETITPPVNSENTSDPLVKSLLVASQAVPFSFMARIPADSGRDPAVAIYGKKLGWYLDKFSQQNGLRHKWHDSILLLENRSDSLAEESASPWSLIKELRASEASTPERVLLLGILANVAWRLTKPQLRELASEFPIMTMVSDWQKTFIELNRAPKRVARIVSERGLPFVEVQPLPPGIEETISALTKEGRNLPVTIHISRNEYLDADKQKYTYLVIALLDKNGDRVHAQDYLYRATKNKEPVEKGIR